MTDAYRDQNFVPTLIASSNLDGKTPVRVYADPITHRLLVDSSSAISILTATGAINSINTQFTFIQEPSFIVSDGAWYRVNLGWTWDGGTLTAKMAVPPNSDIFGIQ